jgi:hypothetical protein
MAAKIMFFLLLLSPIAHSYTDEAINLLVHSITTSDMYRYCIELAKLPNGHTVNITNFGWHLPYLASTSADACNISNLNNYLPSSFSSNTILILYEHECTMTEQSWNIEKQFGQEIVLMIITKRTNTQYQLTYNSTTMPVTIPVVIFWENDFIKINNLSNIELSIDYPLNTPRRFRPAIILMFLLVLIVLLCGNFWAADEFKKKIQDQDMDTKSQLTSANTTRVHIIAKQNTIAPSVASQNKELAFLPMNCCFIIIMICFAVGWLLLIYFFPQVMIYILQGRSYSFIYYQK